jgi:hypothetical protein
VVGPARGETGGGWVGLPGVLENVGNRGLSAAKAMLRIEAPVEHLVGVSGIIPVAAAQVRDSNGRSGSEPDVQEHPAASEIARPQSPNEGAQDGGCSPPIGSSFSARQGEASEGDGRV